MKRILFLLLLVVALLGCPPYEEPTYRIYYHGNKSTSGKPPVDSKQYRSGETAVILERGTLENDDYTFLGWRWQFYGDMRYPGDSVTINWEDINLYAVWDDGTDTPFSFIIENGEVTITRYNDDYTLSISIPETLQSKPVTAIDDNVFSNFSISTISLPKKLKRIGIGAFASNEITRITIPDSVESIGATAFQNNRLRNVTLGNGLKTIEANTFRSNILVTITIPETITLIKSGAFQGNDIETIKIGAGVTIEGDTSLGAYGASFKASYYDLGKQAGLYLYSSDDTWQRQ
jgi:hypothetical protein